MWWNETASSAAVTCATALPASIRASHQVATMLASPKIRAGNRSTQGASPNAAIAAFASKL